MPWVFTQRHPLNLGGFVDEAKLRGFDLSTQLMRELYRHRLLIPFASIQDKADPSQALPKLDEPMGGSSILWQLREAREAGQLYDLGMLPYRSRLPFVRQARFSTGWWNGLVYSWHQLHVLTEVGRLLDHRKYRRREHDIIDILPAPHPHLVGQADEFRRIAIMATALEARYLPKLDPDMIQLSNTTAEEWRRYRDGFDPVAVGRMLGYSGEQARDDAERLLLQAHSIDPLGGAWGKLARRAPKKAWESLKGAALSAMDMRQTAEILLLFYEDLAGRGAVSALPEPTPYGFHPLLERLSYRDSSLDEDLISLGVSPHPRVVLAVEGESEEDHIPKIWEELGYREAPELMRVLRLGGVDRDLQKVAALAAAPLVSGRRGDKHWGLRKPPACLLVATDPEGIYFAPDKVDKTRANILLEIKNVLKSQGAQTTDAELEHLVRIRTWSKAACYEFAHFDDEELAEALIAIHTDVGGLTRDELIARVTEVRGRHGTKNQKTDVKYVWERWNYKPSKVDLAQALWPALRRKIQRCRAGDDVIVPEIVAVVEEAYFTAQHWRYPSFALSAV
ncbi:hypothetical protein [Amycolatopsis sp. cmx-4-68]|uniref:hypothetical protein n=1 Tax=Amycolatopsis sp. cmx-4-68 TaxID=2790938 RepID=UPI00397C54CC